MIFQEFDVDKYIEVQKDEAKDAGKIEGRIEIAKNALLMGLNIEQIEKLTGLNKEEILNLK